MSKRPKKKPFIIAEAESRLFLDAIERLPLHSPTSASHEVELPAPRPKKDKAIDATLDLHGLTREAAWQRLKIFIDRCLFLGHRRIRVIHGKGSGVLREYVRRFLAENSSVTMILDANTRLGGDGAVIVHLKKREASGFTN